MIQNVNATQSRQNFGMALKIDEGFPKQFEKVYNRKGKQDVDEMINTIAGIKREQASNDIFDLHLTRVGPFGGIKTKITSKTKPDKATTLTLSHKIIDIIWAFLPQRAQAPLLEAKSKHLLDEKDLIKNPLAKRVKDIAEKD